MVLYVKIAAATVFLLALPALALPAQVWAQAASESEAYVGLGPSGKPVPRFESLKYGEVNARLGPSLEHRVLWTYHRRGLPVKIIAESDVWRQISDPNGDVSWINAAQLADGQTVFVEASEPLPIRRSPDSEARPVALLGHGVVAALEECRGGWRKVRVGDKAGWAPMASLWGGAQCQKAKAS